MSAASDSEGFTPQSAPELHLAFPMSHVDPGDPPTFMTHGGGDQWIPLEQSKLLVDRLEKQGVPHRLVVLPWARHGFDAAWGGWGTQIVRHELGEFLARRLAD